jgi:tyrosyl-DNA phosphodiesterase 2
MADPWVHDLRPKTTDPEPFIPPDMGVDEDEFTSPVSDSTFSSPPTSGTFSPTSWPSSSSAASPESPVIPNYVHTIRAYRYRDKRGAWKHNPTLSPEEVRDMLDDDGETYPSAVRIVTWNVDFMSEYLEERMTAALRYLERDVCMCRPGEGPVEPTVICLQEVHRDVIETILEDKWVRRNFQVTPISHTKWPEDATYGNITLVSSKLELVKCEIMHFTMTEMTRTALAVYILLTQPGPRGGNVEMCIVNTHLESLPRGAMARPKQMELCSRFLKQPGVRGGVVAGDMNAIGPGDSKLALDCDLRDAWRGTDKDEEGFTWGYQGQNQGRYPCGRLDKILYLPRRGYRMDPLERIGIGAKVKGLGEDVFISDHYGLVTTLRMVPRRDSA